MGRQGPQTSQSTGSPSANREAGPQDKPGRLPELLRVAFSPLLEWEESSRHENGRRLVLACPCTSLEVSVHGGECP